MFTLLLVLVGAPSPITAADAPAERVVAATLNGQPIYVDEVQQIASAMLAQQDPQPALIPLVQAQALEQLIALKLVDLQLASGEMRPSEQEVTAAADALKAQLAAQSITLDQFLQSRKLTADGLRQQLTAELARKKFLESRLDDEALTAYFEAHRREFDGTQLAVSHILLRPSGGEASVSVLVSRAAELREKIVRKELRFADAARKYSAGPSAQHGGELGFIPRQGVMVEAFSQAAFALAEGQISEPVVTRFGVHLIQVTGIKPGERQWGEVRPQLLMAAGKEILESVANQERQSARIEFTGTTPYADPATKKVVLPKGK